MTLDELVCLVSDDNAYATTASITFGPRDGMLSIAFDLKGSKLDGRYCLSCLGVVDFRITKDFFECMSIDTASPHFQSLTGEQHTYVVWGDAINWRKTIGAIMQRFGRFRHAIDPEHLAQTECHQDYRLPVTLPANEADAFLSLLAELGANHHLVRRSPGKTGLRMLWLNSDSYVLALDFTICEA